MKVYLFFLCSFFTISLNAQDAAIVDLFKVAYDTPLTIELNDLNSSEDHEPLEEIKKIKSVNPNVYYGIKSKKGFTKNVKGKNATTELFFFLSPEDFEDPTTFDQNFYYFYRKKKKIVNSKNIPKNQQIGLLHGQYVRKINDQIIEKGYYYKGKKHMRWIFLDRNDILQNKEIYWKGWTQESLLRFYDKKRTHLREVIPIHFGDRQGTYYAFHSDGVVAATGEYRFNEKIGMWKEYYPNKKLKREIKYPNEPYDRTTPALITREWNDKGTLIYDVKKP